MLKNVLKHLFNVLTFSSNVVGSIQTEVIFSLTNKALWANIEANLT